MLKRILSVVMVAVLVFALCSCTGGGTAPSPTPVTTPKASPSPTPEVSANPDMTKTKVTIEMEDGGIIKAELYPEIAPITVENFQNLVAEGFYDGLTFHRVIGGFMIQGGDPLGNGTGGSDKNIKGEFSKNGVANDLEHTRGVLSMARSDAMNSASSQFFIMHEDSPHLDGSYASFGKVTEGMEVVDEIVENTLVEDGNGTVLPENQPKIKTITIEE